MFTHLEDFFRYDEGCDEFGVTASERLDRLLAAVSKHESDRNPPWEGIKRTLLELREEERKKEEGVKD